MNTSTDLINAPKEFLALFKAGKEAARKGDNRKAHKFFRQAIEVDPYHEQVWLWLASVVETDEDRRVCFENVLELNSTNPTARRQLEQLNAKAIAEALNPSAKPKKRAAWKRWLLRLVTAIIAAGIGVAISIVAGFV